jgi:hypothetical protein
VSAHHAAAPRLETSQVTLPRGGWAARLPLLGGIVGLVLLAITFAGAGHDSPVFHGYLIAWFYFVSLAAGCLFFVLLQHITRAGWSVTVRRLAEAASTTLPVLLVLGVPLGFGLHSLYHWSHEEAVAADPILQHKAAWLNPSFFLLRAAIYLVVWSALALWFARQSRRQDEMGAIALTRRMQSAAAPGMMVFGVTFSLAAFDWLMSLEPHWFSTVFGVYVFAGAAIGAFALLIVMALLLQRSNTLSGVVTTEHFQDLGKLLFAFTVFWAYIAFSQFMLIWYAALPEETFWFAQRWNDGWRPWSVALALAHFVVPFFFLLLRDVKRHATGLWIAALWMLAVHWLDLFWLATPGHSPDGPHLHWTALTSFLGVGCLFAGALAWALSRGALVPVNDPRLAESLAFENV